MGREFLEEQIEGKVALAVPGWERLVNENWFADVCVNTKTGIPVEAWGHMRNGPEESHRSWRYSVTDICFVDAAPERDAMWRFASNRGPGWLVEFDTDDRGVVTRMSGKDTSGRFWTWQAE